MTYCTAWKNDEMYQPAVTTPADPRWHIQNSGATRTLCNKFIGPKTMNALPDFAPECRTCANASRAANRKART